MRVIRVVPCLDVDQGRVVKGVNFLGLRDAGDPVELARRYEAEGADELVFLDITASLDERRTMLDVVARTAEQVFIPLTVGGGVRSVADATDLLRMGADKVGVNSAAIARPALISDIAETFGAQCVVVAIDARRRSASDSRTAPASSELDQSGRVTPESESLFEVFTHGGRNATGIDALAWAKTAVSLGAGELLVTSMDRDGTEAGYDIELLKAITDAVEVPVVASGGVGNLDHLAAGALLGGADALLAASIFHFGTYSVGEAKQYLSSRGLVVRPFDVDLGAH